LPGLASVDRGAGEVRGPRPRSMSPENVVDSACHCPGCFPGRKEHPCKEGTSCEVFVVSGRGNIEMGGSDDFSNTIDLACTTVPSLSDLRATTSRRDCLVRWRPARVSLLLIPSCPVCPAGRSALSMATRRRTPRLLSIQIGAREKGNGATTVFLP
jgi:hypothetical protein